MFTRPKSQQKSLKLMIYAYFGPFWDILSQFFHDPPKDKEKSLTPLKILKMPSTPPKNFENGLVPLKLLNMVCTPSKNDGPPSGCF